MLELETKGVEKDTISRVKHIINQFLNSLQKFNGYYILTIDSLMLRLQKINYTMTKTDNVRLPLPIDVTHKLINFIRDVSMKIIKSWDSK